MLKTVVRRQRIVDDDGVSQGEATRRGCRVGEDGALDEGVGTVEQARRGDDAVGERKMGRESESEIEIRWRGRREAGPATTWAHYEDGAMRTAQHSKIGGREVEVVRGMGGVVRRSGATPGMQRAMS